VTFPNYVRRVLLGVPVEGVQPEDPYFSSCSTDEEEEEEEEDDDDGEDAGDGAGDTKNVAEVAATPTPVSSGTTTVDNDDSNATMESMIDLTTLTGINGESAVQPTGTSSTKNTIPERNSPDTPDTKVVDLQYCEVVSSNSMSSSDDTLSQEEIIPLSISSSMESTDTGHHRPKMTTRSQTRSTSVKPLVPNDPSTTMHGRLFPHNSTPPKRKRKMRIQPPLKPDDLKLSDGIAKITPPVGWWDKAGIGNDTTGRGDTWQHNGAMGSMTIPGPIKQCASGIGGVYDFTMMELPSMNVSQFRKKADAYRKRQVGVEFDDNVGNKAMDELARKFWRRLGPTMEASIYGADMEGTLFNGAEACGWNIDRLESCLQLLRADAEEEETTDAADHFRLPGVTSAYLYFGMWASVFAAHTEDMNLPSINYLHAGAPKYWYAISPDDSDRFESLMASQFSCAASACPQFLRHKSHLLSPSIITKAGISYTTQVQRAGDVIITFPGSYHFGFNTGFNCAESTNFAFPEWIPMGEKAKVCMCHPHSVRIDIQRFKALHDKYEFETSYEDGPSMTYDEWAKLEAKHIRRISEDRKIAHDSNEKENKKVPQKTPKKKPKSRGKVVEVVKMLRHRKAMDLVLPTKKSTKKGPEQNDWRLAVNGRKSAFSPRTKVLCNVKSNDFDDVFFSGVISCVVEDHARVHFAGSSKNEDIWIQTNSCKLYLDGGSLESTQEKKVKKKKRVTKKPKKG